MEYAELSPWVRWPIGLGFLVFILFVVFYAEARKRRAWRDFARARKLHYHQDGFNLLSLPDDCFLATKASARGEATVGELIRGVRDGVEVALFEVRWFTDSSSGPRQQGYSQIVVAVRREGVPLPRFVLRPEKWRHKLGEILGGEDIDFVTNPGFSRRYLLRGMDEHGLRQAFTEPVLAFYEARPGRVSEGYGDTLYHYLPTRMLRRVPVKPRQLARLLEEGVELHRLLTAAVPRA